MRKITVYGSLLEGLGNWKWHLDNDQSTKLGEHVLNGGFKMISLGGFPGLIPNEESTDQIFVETYEVTDSVFKSVERLEGYPNFYQRTKVDTPYGESEVYTLNGREYDVNRLVPADEEGIINWRKYRMR